MQAGAGGAVYNYGGRVANPFHRFGRTKLPLGLEVHATRGGITGEARFGCVSCDARGWTGSQRSLVCDRQCAPHALLLWGKVYDGVRRWCFCVDALHGQGGVRGVAYGPPSFEPTRDPVPE